MDPKFKTPIYSVFGRYNPLNQQRYNEQISELLLKKFGDDSEIYANNTENSANIHIESFEAIDDKISQETSM
jgi:hypothetical protein